MSQLAKLKNALKAKGYSGEWSVDAVESWAEAYENKNNTVLQFTVNGENVNVAKAMDVLLRIDEETGSVEVIGAEPIGDEVAMDDGPEDDEEMERAARRAESIKGVRRASASASEWGGRKAAESPEAMKDRALRKSYNLRAKSGREIPGTLKTNMPDADTAEAFGAWVRSQLLEGKSYAQAKRDGEILAKSLGTTTPGLGAEFVPSELAQSLIDLREDVGILAKFLTSRPAPNDSGSLPKAGADMVANWSIENPSADVTESDPGTDAVNYQLKELIGLNSVPNRWLRYANAIDVGDFISLSHVRAIESKQLSAFIDGDGGNTYGGIVGLKNALGLASIVTGAGDNLGALTYNNFVDHIGAQKQVSGALSNPVTLINRRVFFSTIIPLFEDDGSGRRGEVGVATDRASIGGYDFIFVPTLPSATATNTIFMYSGYFNEGVLFTEGGNVEIASDESVRFGRNQTAFRSVSYADIVVHDTGDSSDAGVITALKTSS